MGLFNVVGECVVTTGEGVAKHYPGTHPTPVEVDDSAAAPLIEAGQLTPVEAVDPEPEQPAGDPAPDSPEGEQAPDGEPAQPRRPGRRGGEE